MKTLPKTIKLMAVGEKLLVSQMSDYELERGSFIYEKVTILKIIPWT